MIEGSAVAVIRRFDRTPDTARIAYLSGGLAIASPSQRRSCTH
jgi:hypothetical protein